MTIDMHMYCRILTHYRQIFRFRGGGECRRVCGDFTDECAREAEVDVAQRHLALVRVGSLKQGLTKVCKVNANGYQRRDATLLPGYPRAHARARCPGDAGILLVD